MRSTEERFREWLPTLVFGLWTIALILLLISQRYTAFLRPSFGVLLAVAHFIALGFMLASLVNERTAERGVSPVLRSVVLVVPLLYLVIAPDAEMGGRAFRSRFVGPPPLSVNRDHRFGEFYEEEANRSITPLMGDIQSAELTILDILRDPERYRGRPVAFTGMILRDEKLKEYFAGRDTAAYRFLMTCCAADAMPVAIALDMAASPDKVDFGEDQWVRVEGVFQVLPGGKTPVPVVETATITPVDAPAIPFMF